MAVDYRELSRQLLAFYDFGGKVVLYVGAGGRQLLTPSSLTKKIVAIDSDPEGLRHLNANIAADNAQGSITTVRSSFENVNLSGDVVYFEFCLHEMSYPYAALVQARSLAPDIVVFDHLPGSPWSFYAAEDEDVRRSGEAIERFGIRHREILETAQTFVDYDELQSKLTSQGPVAVERAERDFGGHAEISIPMRYQLALL